MNKNTPKAGFTCTVKNSDISIKPRLTIGFLTANLKAKMCALLEKFRNPELRKSLSA